MRITFDGAGRATKTCDANAECISAATQASWHREWLVEFPGASDIKPPLLIDYFAVQSKWHLRPPCDRSYYGNTQLLDVGALDVGGQLKIQTTVPLTEEEGQVPRIPPPNTSCIGVSVSGTSAGEQAAITKLENVAADFGSYRAWASGAGYAQSRLLSGSFKGLSVGGVATPGHGQWDWVGALSVCTGSCLVSAENQNGYAERSFWIKLAAYVLAKFGNLSFIPPVISPADWTLTLQESVQPARGTSSARTGFVTFATLHQQFRKDRPTTLRPTFAATGRKILARLKRTTTFRARFQLTAAGRPTQRGTFTFSLVPVPPETIATSPPPPRSAGSISSVTFGGSPANPSFTIHGSNLGKLPRTSPASHPSGQSGCPTIAADNGYDYGTSLYLRVPTKNWSGGRAQAGETDCIDLVVTKFTSDEVDFHFGPFYTQKHTQFPLDNGDAVQITVNGVVKTVHVKYGATETR